MYFTYLKVYAYQILGQLENFQGQDKIFEQNIIMMKDLSFFLKNQKIPICLPQFPFIFRSY